MPRTIHEQKRYTKDQLAAMATNYAKLEIVGSMYVGNFESQTIEWKDDGSVVVVTSHVPGDLSDWHKPR